MYLSRNASRARLREAQHARDNRAEIRKAWRRGEMTRRELIKWGAFTASGALAFKNGLSPYAPSAFAADVPTGTPPTPLFGVPPFSQPMPRLALQSPLDVKPTADPDLAMLTDLQDDALFRQENLYGFKRTSWHTEFSQWRDANPGAPTSANPFRNQRTNRGPFEGRAPGEFFAHQLWQTYFPKKAYIMNWGQLDDVGPGGQGLGFYMQNGVPVGMPAQHQNSVWSYAAGGEPGRGALPPPLIKMRYGEPVIARIYNNTPVDPHDNNGFGHNETSPHFHNAHNGGSSDGAANCHFFPGTFYDFHWTASLARADGELKGSPEAAGLDPALNIKFGNRKASGPDDGTGRVKTPGDWREIQGSMWFHDHRFFFTAENVYKGNAGVINMYSGLDRGHESLDDGVNLMLPSGDILPWGNIDFDINLMISDFATDPDGQLFFDIFNTDGFLGDQMLVNFAYKPYFEVIPRKYRLRTLNACMSRFLKLALVTVSGDRIPFQFIANDGNLVRKPFEMRELDYQGTGERYDIVVDFSGLRPGDKVYLVNLAEHDDGRGPDGRVGPRAALRGRSDDPAVGAVMEFRVTDQVESVDDPDRVHLSTGADTSVVKTKLTQNIPIIEPVRHRHIEWRRGGGDDPELCQNGRDETIPPCQEFAEAFPWSVRVNGEDSHTLNANRISALIPVPGQTEHWTYENGGGGWDHPIHLHYEEGVTMNRGGDSINRTERNVRKDVWRLREGGSVTFQVTFGEFAGSYVSHCHNTVHEDFAMLMRFQTLGGDNEVFLASTPTPMPSEDGVTFRDPEIIPEADPRNLEFFIDNATRTVKALKRDA